MAAQAARIRQAVTTRLRKITATSAKRERAGPRRKALPNPTVRTPATSQPMSKERTRTHPLAHAERWPSWQGTVKIWKWLWGIMLRDNNGAKVKLSDPRKCSLPGSESDIAAPRCDAFTPHLCRVPVTLRKYSRPHAPARGTRPSCARLRGTHSKRGSDGARIRLPNAAPARIQRSGELIRELTAAAAPHSAQ